MTATIGAAEFLAAFSNFSRSVKFRMIRQSTPGINGTMVVVKLNNSTLRSGLLSNRTLNADSTPLNDMTLIIQIGSQSFGHPVDTMYTVKNPVGCSQSE